MLKVKLAGSYKASRLRTGGQRCLSHKNLSSSHVLTSLTPYPAPSFPKHLPEFPLSCSAPPCYEEKTDRGQTQDSPHPVSDRQGRKGTDVPGRCQQVLQSCPHGESLPLVRSCCLGRGSSPTEEVAVTGLYPPVRDRIWRWW